MPRLRKISGSETVKILCNKFGFTISGRTGSHVRLNKIKDNIKIGTVVPLHEELKNRNFKISIEVS